MHTRGGDAVKSYTVTPQVRFIVLIIQRSGVNYSAYTMVAIHQSDDIFQGIRPVFVLKSLL